MENMHTASKRVTRSSASRVKEVNGECGGEVNPTVDKVSEQQNNASVPLKTSEAESHMPNDANEDAHLHDEVMENGKGDEEQKPTPETRKTRSNTKFSGSHRELVLGLPCRGQFETPRSKMSATSSKRLGGGGERNVLFSSHKRAQESKEAAASSSAGANSTPVDRPKKRKKVMKNGKVKEDDEYTRIKKKLRYLLNRINYEQNLIDAYSLEGWKGSSMEKIRPEKELERATKEILRRKVKIRDLFQHLDTLCAEGSLPESLFDSDGEICSEDIFCAKCGSKDLPVDNDIILCDGFCDRGFHQYCVEPPLRKEDIPPDDESWLCPGCDCKDDCLDLLNDSLGTRLSVSDSWEKVFPEAAAVLAGGDQNLDGLNDNENDEDGSGDNYECENEDGSSDESDFTSASDEMIESFKKGKDIMDDIMNLPSDDSEDDDYDPDAPKLQENSNSDCSSDSEDLETSCKGKESNQQDEITPLEDAGGKKSQLLNDANSESDDMLDDGLAGVPRRRSVERLDYKKLYDEEYENVPSSSSDDDDFSEDFGSEDEGDTVPLKQSLKSEDHNISKKSRQTSKKADKTESLKVPQEGPEENGSSGEKGSSSANKQTDPKTQVDKKGKDIMDDIMNLPSDDSEDDDYDPDAPTCDEDKLQENSNSDCSSESEDLETSLECKESNQQDEITPLEDAGRKKSKSQLPNDTISDSDAMLDDVPRRRNVERLDYKKLYDEEYENVPSSSSDDDDFSEDEGDTVPLKQSSDAENHNISKKSRQTSKKADKTESLKVPQEGPGENGSSVEKGSSSANKPTDPKTERLFQTFHENRYPDKATRESLAKELQMTITQVNNWFKNRRSSRSKLLAAKEDVEELKTGEEGEGEKTYVAGSSKQTMETKSAAKSKSVASESTNPGSRKRRRR